jgi:Flp pilus assembly protein TadD
MPPAFKSDLDEIAKRAAAALERGELDEALRLWSSIRSHEPADPISYIQAGIALRRLGRPEDADAIFLQGMSHCANMFELTLEYAWTAHYRLDWPEAMARWTDVANRFPGVSHGPVGVARCLIQLGRADEVEPYLAAFGFAPPNDMDVSIVLAEIASVRGDWTEAVRRWSVLRSAYPDNSRVIDGYGQALWQLHSDEGEQAALAAPARMDALPRPVEITVVRDVEIRDLMLRFQSLGENCEFGLVQRRFGAEPIGLLRWTYVKPERAVQLLSNRFAGIGSEAGTRLNVSKYGEYFIEDLENDLVFHTFIAQSTADPDGLLTRHRKRLGRLRERLIEDLQNGEHIFVYKVQYGATRSMERMQAAIRAYGPGALLCVRAKDADNPAGSVTRGSDGMLTGYLDRVGPSVQQSNEVWDIAFDDWIAVCREALRLQVKGAVHGL